MSTHRSPRLLSLGLACLLVAACGGGGSGSSEPPAPSPPVPSPSPSPAPSPPPPPPPAPAPPPAAPGGLYIGWYEEDPGNNPEDPTVGALFMRLPAGDGAFAGLMPFSYVGCRGGINVGTMAGARSGNNLAGTWTGTLDGAAVGGGFSAEYADARFDGRFQNAAGKQAISAPPCLYSMAAQGRFRLFNGPASEPAEAALSFSASSTTPTVTWRGLPAAAIGTLRVFDEACLETAPTAACFLGEVASSSGSSAAPATLALGGRYIFVLTAQTALSGSQAGIAGFASARFSPTVVGSGGGTGGGGSAAPGTAAGALTVSGMASAARFAPGGPLPVQGPSGDGPTCTPIGSGSICSSTWTLSWNEVEGSTPTAQLLVMVTSTTSSTPGPVPGSRVDALRVQFTDFRSPLTLYQYACGLTALGEAACADVPGLQVDLAARRVHFNALPLRVPAPGSGGPIRLDGSLGY